MDKSFYARCNFNECAVVSHNNNFTFNFVANFEVGVQSIPRMGKELLQAESDALLLVVEVEDNNVEFLVELNNFVRVVNSTPREVGDVDKTVYAAEVDKHTVRGDVLNSTFEHLTFLKLGNDVFLLLLELCFDESFVRYDYVLVFLVDLHDLELHSLAYEYVIVANLFNVDL